MMLAGALRAYKRSLELHREAARKERDQRVRTLRRAQAVRARMVAQAAENGDAGAQVGAQVRICYMSTLAMNIC